MHRIVSDPPHDFVNRANQKVKRVGTHRFTYFDEELYEFS